MQEKPIKENNNAPPSRNPVGQDTALNRRDEYSNYEWINIFIIILAPSLFCGIAAQRSPLRGLRPRRSNYVPLCLHTMEKTWSKSNSSLTKNEEKYRKLETRKEIALIYLIRINVYFLALFFVLQASVLQASVLQASVLQASVLQA